MSYTRDKVAKLIDHSVLRPEYTDQDIIDNAQMCRELGVGCMCVRPSDAPLAVGELEGSSCRVAMVVGFPHGSNEPEVKVQEAKIGIEEGVKELDVVMNIGKFLSGDEGFVQKEIEAIVAVATPARVLVKVILETSLLSAEQIEKATDMARLSGADFVKTSTGFNGGGATTEAIDVMLKAAGAMGVKASGGIKNWETAVAFLEQGCKRLGLSSTKEVLAGAPAEVVAE